MDILHTQDHLDQIYLHGNIWWAFCDNQTSKGKVSYSEVLKSGGKKKNEVKEENLSSGPL